jgi:ABC-type lipoprotein export system ATPase subunit
MNYQRGSLWRKCDFHIHTPYSALENKFGDNFDTYVQTLFRKAIEKQVAIIGITDYFSIKGYKKIKTEYLESDAKLKSLFTIEEISKIKEILIIPNIEFRLNKIVQIIKIKDGQKKIENGRVNFHVFFSDQVPIKQIEENFLHDLDFVYESDPNERDKLKKLKEDNLIALGDRLRVEQQDLNGTSLQIGMTMAVVNDEQIMELLTSNKDFKDKYFIAVPADEDLSEISWKSQDHLVRKILISRSNALLAANPNTIEFGLGKKSPSIEDFIKEFKSIKPCIWGSDAHGYEKLYEPDKERYCWIKADPTFEGIRQIFFEPGDRVFIGKYPKLYERIKANLDNYISSINIKSTVDYNGRNGLWFKDFKLELGLELIAIIGNKGKGKSAIADIIGLLGNAQIDRKDFSFLRTDKFCQKGFGEYFTASIKFYDGSQIDKRLNDDIDKASVERVKYIPQAYLEKLCNNEDGGFTEELNKVVFSRLDDSDKLGKKSFKELEEYQTLLINQKIEELKSKIAIVIKLNLFLLGKNTATYKTNILNKLDKKKQELLTIDTERSKIPPVPNPETDPKFSTEQKTKAGTITTLISSINQVLTEIQDLNDKLSLQKIRSTDLNLILKDVTSMKERFDEWKSNHKEQFEKYELDIDKIISLTISTDKIEKLIEEEKITINTIEEKLSSDTLIPDEKKQENLYYRLDTLNKQKEALEKELEKPFKDWNEYQTQLRYFISKQQEIIGNADTDETIKFYEKELSYIENRLQSDIERSVLTRSNLILEIYQQKKQIQLIYHKMKSAITSILEKYSAEQNITMETSFKLDRHFHSKFFDYVNRYGYFYSGGDEELKKMMQNYDYNNPSDIISFINNIDQLDIRFKDGRQLDFYTFICSLDYIHPEYDLRLNGKSLLQLSPGEKGGLLLVFYLVLDKDNKPLIIDQPEDNLDNQSVAEILVPYIKDAKKMRQIIMITHNPNLAIVADAEQIIYMDINKEGDYLVSSETGSIENPKINHQIVNILEGKMRAFNNRRIKYRPDSRLFQ